jgi:hypothetical protein
MSAPDPFACACDPDAPVCACLPLWIEPAADDEPEGDE